MLENNKEERLGPYYREKDTDAEFIKAGEKLRASENSIKGIIFTEKIKS